MPTHDGGKPHVRDVMNYQPPQGPSNIGDGHSPGLHGHNHGNGQCPIASHEGGHVGIGGTNRGNEGSQRPGTTHPMGTGRPII